MHREGPCERTATWQPSACQGEASGNTKPVRILIWDFQSPELWEKTPLLLKPPGLWHYDGSLSRLRHSPRHTRYKEEQRSEQLLSKEFLFLFFFFLEDGSWRWENCVNYQWVSREVQSVSCTASFTGTTRKWLFQMWLSWGFEMYLIFGTFQFSLLFMAICQGSSQVLSSATFLHSR